MTRSLATRGCSLTLAPDLADLARAREFVRAAALQAGFSEDRAFDVIVACSEAMANAIEHAPVKAQVKVTTSIYSDRLEVEVAGTGEFQTPQLLQERSHRGMGLPLMAKLADHLAIYSAPSGGTQVNLTFFRPGASRGEQPLSLEEQRDRAARRILEQAPAPVYQIDFRGPKFVMVNDLMCEQSGYSREELLEMSPLALLDEASGEKFRARVEAGLAGEPMDDSVEYTWITKDGRRLTVLLDASFLYEDGRTVSAVVVGRDVTAQKLAEQELRRSEERQALLLRLSDALRCTPDPPDMRRQAARLLGEHLGADRVYFAESSLESGSSFVLSDYRRRGLSSLVGSRQAVHFPSILRVLARGKPFTVKDVETSGRVSGTLRGILRSAGFGSLAAVALVKTDQTIWSASVAFAGRHEWTRAELSLLREVADRTWSAVERAEAEAALRESEQRHRLLAAENERLYRQQLDIAENLQLALLNIPSEIGPLKLGHLYRSATAAARVGGDFYDVFEVKEGNVAILIGDVAGHGIQAARTATLVKDVVNAFTHQSLRPHEVLRRTNMLLIEKELPGFVSVFLGILNKQTGYLRYSSAGHPEALVRRSSGEIERLGCGYSPLGVYPEASWKPHEIDLRVQDLLLLYTDGVIEARRSGELFGEKRLERLMRRKRLPPQRLPHLILDQVLAFAGGRLEDDVAVLALALNEVADEPEKLRNKQESLLN